MEAQLLNEVIACLPAERTVFRYARDEYAIELLSRYVGEGKPVSEIKRSVFRGLLEKPAVKLLLSACGQGEISRRDFQYVYINDRQDFVLTVGKWDMSYESFSQTTRNSANLVLHLNFNKGHDSTFHHLIGNEELDYFRYESHPILRQGERRQYRNTLGWARLDFDLDTGEVLIEEVQNDWLRRATRYFRMMAKYIDRHPDYREKLGIRATRESIEQYVKRTLSPFYKIWDEAILTAVVRFAVDELGINRIYYHTFNTGNQLKQISWSHPPKSIYTDLPRKFCFTVTDELPSFLQKSKVVKRKLRKIKHPRWQVLSV